MNNEKKATKFILKTYTSCSLVGSGLARQPTGKSYCGTSAGGWSNSKLPENEGTMN